MLLTILLPSKNLTLTLTLSLTLTLTLTQFCVHGCSGRGVCKLNWCH